MCVLECNDETRALHVADENSPFVLLWLMHLSMGEEELVVRTAGESESRGEWAIDLERKFHNKFTHT